jgi:hypothetical protein
MHETEQLRMCVKNLRSVTDNDFKLASNVAIESLESVLKHRVRSIVGEAIGADASTAASFMGSSVMGGGKGSDRVAMQMNYIWMRSRTTLCKRQKVISLGCVRPLTSCSNHFDGIWLHGYGILSR